MNENATYYYLKIRGQLITYISNTLEYLFPVKRVRIIETDKEKYENYIYRYYLISVFKYLIKLLQNIINVIDKNCQKMEVTYRTNTGDNKVILDSGLEGNSLSLEDVDRFKTIPLDKIPKSKHMVTKIELHHNDDKQCIKKYINIYSDNDGDHSTIGNVFMFNEIDNDDDSSIYIEYFKTGKIIKSKYKLKDIRNRHIDFIYTDDHSQQTNNE